MTITSHAGVPESVSMDQQAPRCLAKLQDVKPLAAALGLQPIDIASDRLPAQVVFTGAHHLLVPIKGRNAVDRITPDARLLLGILARVKAEGCYVFSLDPLYQGASAYSRFFNPTVGIWEDPATGTAAGPLAAALVAHGLAKQSEPVLIEQGTAMGRTSLIRAEVLSDTVRISGRGVLVATGQLRL